MNVSSQELLRAKLQALDAYHAGQMSWQDYRAEEARLNRLLTASPQSAHDSDKSSNSSDETP